MKPSIPFILLLTLSVAAFAGCASPASKNPIPRRGDVVAQGTGTLSFRAPAAGLASVYDINSNSVIHSSAVKEGTVVALNPQAGNITVTDADRAGSQVVHSGVSKSHRYEIWFIPSHQMGSNRPATAPATR
jgi:hypothetical protein